MKKATLEAFCNSQQTEMQSSSRFVFGSFPHLNILKKMNIRAVWDHKDEALFIELVRQYPPLWNRADRNYPKKGLRKVLYMQIAEELKKRWPDRAHLITADSLRHKFNGLRTYFTREIRKWKMWNKTNTVRSFRKWIHFNKMLFLTEKNGRNESDLNISIVRIEGGIRDDDDNEMEHNYSAVKTSCCDSNEVKDSSLPFQPFEQSCEEAVEFSLKREILDNLPVARDSIVLETPVNAIVAETSYSDNMVGADSSLLQSSAQSNEETVGPSVKIEIPDDSSPVCVPFVTETPINAIVSEATSTNRNEGMNSSLSLQPYVQSNEEDAKSSLERRKSRSSSPVFDLVETEIPVILNTQSASVQVSPVFIVGSENLVSTSLNQIPTEKANEPPKEIQLNKEAAEPSLKRKKKNNAIPVRDLFDTPVTAVVSATSCPDSNERTNSSLSLQLPSVQSNEEAAESPLKRKKLINSSPMCDSTETETTVISKSWSASAEGPPTFNVALGNLVVASLNQMSTEKANAATKEIFDVLLKYGRETNNLR